MLTPCTIPLPFTSLYCRVGDATMSLRTAGSVLVVFLWSVAVVLGQDVWSVTYSTQSICTLKGSSVDLFCFYTYPSGTVTTTFWFTKIVNLRDDPDYKGRVTYRSDRMNVHTLKITDLRERDSAEYKFRFITDQTGEKYTGDPGVTLSVTGTVILYMVLICLITLSVTGTVILYIVLICLITLSVTGTVILYIVLICLITLSVTGTVILYIVLICLITLSVTGTVILYIVLICLITLSVTGTVILYIVLTCLITLSVTGTVILYIVLICLITLSVTGTVILYIVLICLITLLQVQ
uniref:Immunoglobulin subtype domain-containing protein n=1 Tax=Oncorhynchus mykiss TaxID=8022 RepID=A0A8K9VCY4_ONCMY